MQSSGEALVRSPTGDVCYPTPHRYRCLVQALADGDCVIADPTVLLT